MAKLMYIFILISCIAILPSLVSASDVLIWQGQYYTGTTFNTGTYEFNFSVYDALTGGDICYSNTTTLTTGSFGEWSTEQSGVNAACNDTTKDYYLDISINGVEQPSRRLLTVWNSLRKNVDETTSGKLQANSQIIAPIVQANSQIIAPIVNATQIIANNLTTNYGFFNYLGSLVNRITKLFVQDIDASGNVKASNYTLNGTTIQDWNDLSFANGTNGINGTNGLNGTNGANLTMTSIVNNGDGTYTWHFSDGTNYTTGDLTGPQGIPGVNGTNGTTANLTDYALKNQSETFAGNITANYFIGDGSQLTGISGGNSFDQNLNTTNDVSFNHLNVTNISIGGADRYLSSSGPGDLELGMNTPASSLNIRSADQLRLFGNSIFLTGNTELDGQSDLYSASENAFTVSDDIDYAQAFRVDTINQTIFAKSCSFGSGGVTIDANGHLLISTNDTSARPLTLSGNPNGYGEGLRITNTGSGGGDWTLVTTNDQNGEGGGKFLLINELVPYPNNLAFAISADGMGIFNPHPQASLDVNAAILSTSDVTDVSANDTGDFGGYSVSNGSFDYTVTAYRTVNGVKIYSANPYSSTFTPSGNNDPYGIAWNFGSPNNVDGIILYDTTDNRYVDVAKWMLPIEYNDDNSGWTSGSPSDMNLTSYTSNALKVNGDSEMNGNLNITGNLEVGGCIQYNCSQPTGCVTLGVCT